MTYSTHTSPPCRASSRLTWYLLLSGMLTFFCTSASASPVEINRTPVKIVREEVLQLGAETYSIPEPWRGNRITAPVLEFSDFRQVPPEHTRDGAKIYVTTDAHTALLTLLEAAKADNVHLTIESGYRSPAYQKRIFLRMIEQGRAFNDIIRYVAPPGYSQHALGTAVDFSPSNWRFADSQEYQWLHANGAQFGFSETYSENNALRYPWEAWHWNYTPGAVPIRPPQKPSGEQ